MTELLARSVAPDDQLLDEWGMPAVHTPAASIQSPGPTEQHPKLTQAGRKKRAPRVGDGEPRSKPLGIRLHPRERSALIAAARRTRRDDVSAWAREVLLAHAAKEVVPYVGDECLQELLRLRRDLNSGVGNNLNQVLTWANREAKMGRAPDRRTLLEAVQAAQGALDAVRTELGRILHPRGRR